MARRTFCLCVVLHVYAYDCLKIKSLVVNCTGAYVLVYQKIDCHIIFIIVYCQVYIRAHKYLNACTNNVKESELRYDLTKE